MQESPAATAYCVPAPRYPCAVTNCDQAPRAHPRSCQLLRPAEPLKLYDATKPASLLQIANVHMLTLAAWRHH